MNSLENYRWRKATDINREFATFELLVGTVVILVVGFNDAGVFEVAFNDAIGGIIIELSRFDAIVEEGRRLAEAER